MLLKISLENFWYNMEKLQNIMTMIWYYPEHLKFCGKINFRTPYLQNSSHKTPVPDVGLSILIILQARSFIKK